MPKSRSGRRAMRGFKKSYGKRRGASVAYATANARASEGKPGLFKALHGRSPKKKKS